MRVLHMAHAPADAHAPAHTSGNSKPSIMHMLVGGPQVGGQARVAAMTKGAGKRVAAKRKREQDFLKLIAGAERGSVQQGVADTAAGTVEHGGKAGAGKAGDGKVQAGAPAAEKVPGKAAPVHGAAHMEVDMATGPVATAAGSAEQITAASAAAAAAAAAAPQQTTIQMVVGEVGAICLSTEDKCDPVFLLLRQ